MHTYLHTNMHTYIHTNMHAYIHTYIHTYIQAIARHGRQGYTRVALHTTISDQPSSISDAYRVLFVGDDTVRGSRPRDFLGTLVILELARNVDFGDSGSNESVVQGPRGKVG